VVSLSEINANPQVMEFYPACLTYEETQSFIQKNEEKMSKGEVGFLAIESKETGDFLGFIGLNKPCF
jgi:ribosomal-protein-alanine N-acetyltransferase